MAAKEERPPVGDCDAELKKMDEREKAREKAEAKDAEAEQVAQAKHPTCSAKGCINHLFSADSLRLGRCPTHTFICDECQKRCIRVIPEEGKICDECLIGHLRSLAHSYQMHSNECAARAVMVEQKYRDLLHISRAMARVPAGATGVGKGMAPMKAETRGRKPGKMDGADAAKRKARAKKVVEILKARKMEKAVESVKQVIKERAAERVEKVGKAMDKLAQRGGPLACAQNSSS